MNASEKELMERAVNALEGLEMLIAMWLEKSIPAGEIWIGEGPERDMLKRPWRPGKPETAARAQLVSSDVIQHRVEHVEERLDRLNKQVADLENRIHEEIE